MKLYTDEMQVVILKYNAGNIRSVAFALDRIGVTPIITDDPEEIRSADKVIIPGVGEASGAMRYLKERKLDELLISLKQPVLGICLGMQLLCSDTEEGNTKCLGIFSQSVKKFTGKLKSPQIGWNTISNLKSDLFLSIPEQTYVYFVHGYYVEAGNHTTGESAYGIQYSSAMQKENFYAVQFHPEKSGEAGQRILENFISKI